MCVHWTASVTCSLSRVVHAVYQCADEDLLDEDYPLPFKSSSLSHDSQPRCNSHHARNHELRSPFSPSHQPIASTIGPLSPVPSRTPSCVPHLPSASEEAPPQWICMARIACVCFQLIAHSSLAPPPSPPLPRLASRLTSPPSSPAGWSPLHSHASSTSCWSLRPRTGSRWEDSQRRLERTVHEVPRNHPRQAAGAHAREQVQRRGHRSFELP